MFNNLREELNKISLLESNDEEEIDSMEYLGDNGAADDELVDDIDEDYEEMEDEIAEEVESGKVKAPTPEMIDKIVEALIIEETIQDQYDDSYNEDYDYDDDEDYDYDDYDDSYNEDYDYDDEDYDDDDYEDDEDYDAQDMEEEDEYSEDDDIDLEDDIYEDSEEEYDDLLEGMCDDDCDELPPEPQCDKVKCKGKATGNEFVDFGNSNYKKYGNVFLDKDSSIKDDEVPNYNDRYYDGNGRDSGAGDLYNARNKATTKGLFGNNECSAKEDALDESVSTFLSNYLD